MFPAAFCGELSQLRNQVAGFPPPLAVEAIEASLGRPVHEIFSEFEMAPLAGASIAQVHRARLLENGARVVIKVRRPGTEAIFAADMRFMNFASKTLMSLSILPHFRWTDLAWEFNQFVREELDYRFEAANQNRMAKSLAGHPIYVPHVYSEWSTADILVMEYVEGVTLEDYISCYRSDPQRAESWAAANDIEPRKVGRHLLFSFMRQFMEDNLFHADMHPGNIMLLRGNRVVFLDFGSIGNLEGDNRRKYLFFLEFLAQGAYAKATDLFLLIMPDLPAGNLEQVKQELMRKIHRWRSRCNVENLPFDLKSASVLQNEMITILGRYRILIFWPFFRIIRAWSTLDESLRVLAPKENLPTALMDYMKERRIRDVVRAAGRLPKDMIRLQDLIDMPMEQYEKAIYKGAGIRRLAQVFVGTTTRLSQLVAFLIRAVGLIFFLLTAFLIGNFANQHIVQGQLQKETLMGSLLGSVPALDLQVWILVFMMLIAALLNLAGLARETLREEMG